jgi:hypothetical protein
MTTRPLPLGARIFWATVTLASLASITYSLATW